MPVGARIIRGGAFENHASLGGLGAVDARLDDWLGHRGSAGSSGGVEEGASRFFTFAFVAVPLGSWGSRISPSGCSLGEEFVPALLDEFLDQRVVIAGGPEGAGFAVGGVGTATVGAFGNAFVSVTGLAELAVLGVGARRMASPAFAANQPVCTAPSRVVAPLLACSAQVDHVFGDPSEARSVAA